MAPALTTASRGRWVDASMNTPAPSHVKEVAGGHRACNVMVTRALIYLST